jgi:hypothetical protein
MPQSNQPSKPPLPSKMQFFQTRACFPLPPEIFESREREEEEKKKNKIQNANHPSPLPARRLAGDDE